MTYTPRLMDQPLRTAPISLTEVTAKQLSLKERREWIYEACAFVWSDNPGERFTSSGTQRAVCALPQGAWIGGSWTAILNSVNLRCSDIAKAVGARNGPKTEWSDEDFIEDLASIFTAHGVKTRAQTDLHWTTHPAELGLKPGGFLKRKIGRAWHDVLLLVAERMRAGGASPSQVKEVDAYGERARKVHQGRAWAKTPAHEKALQLVVVGGPDGPLHSELNVIATLDRVAFLEGSTGYTYCANGPDIMPIGDGPFRLLGELHRSAELKTKASKFRNDREKNHDFADTLIMWEDDRCPLEKSENGGDTPIYPARVICLRDYIISNAEQLLRMAPRGPDDSSGM